MLHVTPHMHSCNFHQEKNEMEKKLSHDHTELDPAVAMVMWACSYVNLRLIIIYIRF